MAVFVYAYEYVKTMFKYGNDIFSKYWDKCFFSCKDQFLTDHKIFLKRAYLSVKFDDRFQWSHKSRFLDRKYEYKAWSKFFL